MKHLSEEQIVLHYYGDTGDEDGTRRHLAECAECREEFERVRELLRAMEAPEVPEPPAGFEEKTWLNLRDRLPVKGRTWMMFWTAAPKLALAGIMCLLLAGAFFAGRFWPWHGSPPTPASAAAPNPQRVILFAVGGHLERSQMLLVEIMNTDSRASLDLTAEQQQARDLLDANHLYRVSAQEAGDRRIAMLLDQLGRILAEVANGPTEVSPDDLQRIRSRIRSDNLLFKVRVVGSEVNSRVRRQEGTPSARPNQRL